MTLRGEDGEVRTIALAELRAEADEVGRAASVVAPSPATATSRYEEDSTEEADVASSSTASDGRGRPVDGDDEPEPKQRPTSPQSADAVDRDATGHRCRRRARSGDHSAGADVAVADATAGRWRRTAATDRPSGAGTRTETPEWAKFYLTTAIDYANGDPHIGHAYEKIGADAIARYRRMRGDDVYFLTGLDEHGQKVAQAAAERGVSPQEFVDEHRGALRGDVAPAVASRTTSSCGRRPTTTSAACAR